MDVFVHTNLITQIRKSLTIYKKYNSLFDQGSKETVEMQMLKYQTLAAEITTLGGLMNAGGENREKILNDSVVLDLLTIMGHPKTDPILLTAICTFAYDVFECEEIMDDEERMSPYQQAIQNLNFMIPYLGFERYPDLLQMTKRYHSIQNSVAKQGDDQEAFQPNDKMDMNIDSSNGPEANQLQILASLSHLDDYIVNDLFKSIIRLVELICRQASVNKKNSLFQTISSNLDDCQREQALFNCLEIPNDDVRLAVVKCLFVIPIREFQMSEIAHITKIMSNCNNIGAGKTEHVLSTIYWICTKFVCGDTEGEEGSSARIFQEKFGEKTVNEAVNILQRNLIRIVEVEEEDVEKYTLSLSILNFLKASSDKPMMRKYLRGKNSLFRKILTNEDNYSSKLVKSIPIDIETTMFGREMQPLIECISASDSPEAYGDVSLRVIMRMADILMYRHSYKKFDIEGEGDVIRGLMDFASVNYTKKKSREIDFWVDKPARFTEELNEKAIEELTSQHNNFTSKNGVALLQIFLTSKTKINEILLKELVSDCFNDQITAKTKAKGETKAFGADIKDKLSSLEQQFKKNYCKDEYSIRRTMYEKELKKKGDMDMEEDKDHAHEREATPGGTPGQATPGEECHGESNKKPCSKTNLPRLR